MNEIDSKSINRRAFLRVPSAMPCRLICLRPDGSLPEEGWVDAEIVELGGGGARILTDLSVTTDCVLSIRLPIPDTGPTIRLSARVVAIHAEAPVRQVAVKFVGISESDRSLLIRHVFAAQLRMTRSLHTEQGTEDRREDG
jgi:c-di-GMP-binding flagellar brake protein YcgR